MVMQTLVPAPMLTIITSPTCCALPLMPARESLIRVTSPTRVSVALLPSARVTSVMSPTLLMVEAPSGPWQTEVSPTWAQCVCADAASTAPPSANATKGLEMFMVFIVRLALLAVPER